MKEIALEFIKIINDNGFKAYIVGGYVRDYLMNLESNDIDVTTSATPKEIKKIFKNAKITKDSYGSVQVIYKNLPFEVTTFREESSYFDNRHPSSIKYIDDLETDLKRRDFTINAICMDKEGNIIDPLNGGADIKNKIIRTINESNKSFQDDALRILRALRFSVTLNFKLAGDIVIAISKNKHLLKNISYERKKIELDKIFTSLNAKSGIELIKNLGLASALDLENLDRIKYYTDIVGIWSMINSKCYKFNKHEKELIKKVNIVYDLDNLNELVLYKYGLYVNILAGINKGLSKKEINEAYDKLPIKAKSDIQVTSLDICKLLNKNPDAFLNDIYNNLEIEILRGNLINKKEDILEYIKNNF